MSNSPKGARYMTLEEIRGMTTQDNYHMGLAVDAGTVAGCAEAPIRELQIFGKTEKKSTKGLQLISSYANGSKTDNERYYFYREFG